MRIPALIFGLMALILPGAGLGAPEIASISKMSGLVRVSHAPSVSDWSDAKPAMNLRVQDRVKTLEGSNDRAEIRFKDGSVIRLAPRTTFEISAYEEDNRGRLKKIASRLFGGMLRAVVNKLEPDQQFQIYSTHAVASVKGTDFIFDGSTVTVIDEKDGIRHAVVMTDPTGGHIIEVLQGMMGGLHEDGTPINPTAIDPAVLNEILKGLDVVAPGSGGSGGGGDALEGSGGGDGDAPIDPNSLRGDLQDLADSQDLSDIADNEERFTDAMTGAVLIDMNGYRVRAEQYVMHPAPDTIDYLALNLRDGGPNAGLTYQASELVFNKALPDNFEDVRRGLPAAFGNPNGGVPPEYYLLTDSFVVANPAGDFLMRLSSFGPPQATFDIHVIHYNDAATSFSPMIKTDFSPGSYDVGSMSWIYDETGGTQTGWGQQAAKMLFIGSSLSGNATLIPKESFRYDRYGRVEAGWYSGCNPVVDPLGEWNYSMAKSMPEFAWILLYPVSISLVNSIGVYTDADIAPGTPGFDNSNFGTGTKTAFADERGGLVQRTTYGDNTWLNIRNYAVNAEGQVVQSDMLEAVANGSEDISALGDGVNLETVYEAPEWVDPATNTARTIDIMLMPESAYQFTDGEPIIMAPPVSSTPPPF